MEGTERGSTAFYNPKFVEGRERCYNILLDFAESSYPELFLDFNLPFGGTKDAELERRT